MLRGRQYYPQPVIAANSGERRRHPPRCQGGADLVENGSRRNVARCFSERSRSRWEVMEGLTTLRAAVHVFGIGMPSPPSTGFRFTAANPDTCATDAVLGAPLHAGGT